MMNFISKKFLGVMVALAIFALPALAEVGVGVDAVSKYVMRGTAVGSGVALQPSVDYTLGGGGGGLFAEGSTTVGLWGSYSLVNGSNDWESMGVISNNSYGIDSEIFFSFPLNITNSSLSIINNLVISEAASNYIKKSEAELISERDIIKDILKS